MTEYIEKFWRPATAADVARVMAGEEVEARFRDSEDYPWRDPYKLGGWDIHGPMNWRDGSGTPWVFCQVYDPPQWWLDKPEPGEGYRLLGKEPDEPVQGGDFFKNAGGRWIELVNRCNPAQAEGIWYRRKIEPKPEPKHKVGQRVRIIGPKVRPAAQWEGGMDQYIGLVDVVDRVHVYGDKSIFFHLAGVKKFDFREDYLEPVFEPEPKHYVLRVGDTVETPRGHRVHVLSQTAEQINYKPKVGDTIETPAGYLLTITDRGYSAKAP